MKKKKNIILIIVFVCCLLLIWKKNTSENNMVTYQNSSNELFILQGRKKINTKINNSNDNTIINNKYLVYSKNNKLCLYNITNKKTKVISKNYQALIDHNNHIIIYSTRNHIFIYNLNKNRYQKIDNVSDIKTSSNGKNIIYRKKNNLVIYNLSKQKEIIKVKNVEEYKCMNDSCTKFYFTRLGKLGYFNQKEKNLKTNIINILWNDKTSIIYQTQREGEYTLYYRNKNKVIELDKNKRIHEDIIVNGKMIIYLSGGNCKEVQKNGKNRKIINRSVDKIIDRYQGKYLLLKNNSLYLNDKLLDDKIKEDSIIVKGNKIYYLQNHQDIDWLIEKTNKKKKILNKNVIKVMKKNKNIYYLGDYNLYRKYGNIYIVNNKKKLAKKVNDIK